MGRGDIWWSGKASQPSSCESDLDGCVWHFSTLKQLFTRWKDTLWLRYRLTPGMAWSLDGISWGLFWMSSVKTILGIMSSAFIFFITLSTWKTSNASQVLMKDLSTNPIRNWCMLFSFHRLGSWGTERRGLLFWSGTWVGLILGYRLEGPFPNGYLCSALRWGDLLWMSLFSPCNKL